MKRLTIFCVLGLILALGGCDASVDELGPVSESPQMPAEQKDAMQEYMKKMQKQYKSKGVRTKKDYTSEETK